MNATGMSIAKKARKAAQHSPPAQAAPADAPVTRIELPGLGVTPNRMCAMSAVAFFRVHTHATLTAKLSDVLLPYCCLLRRAT